MICSLIVGSSSRPMCGVTRKLRGTWARLRLKEAKSSLSHTASDLCPTEALKDVCSGLSLSHLDENNARKSEEDEYQKLKNSQNNGTRGLIVSCGSGKERHRSLCFDWYA
ncbi:hypothetical protein Efla_005550 [Eimeria flavescens]